MKKKRLVAASLAGMLLASSLTACAGSANNGEAQTGASESTQATQGVAESEIKKPEKITIMVDGTVTKLVDNRDAFEKKWEELTGIELEIIQPDHSAYYDVLGQTFASGVENWPDIMILSASYYSGYAGEGALWDMTEAWENSELKASGRVTSTDIIDNLKIDGKLYGFPVNRGNGCITYIKKAWLDNVGMEAPKTYDEYMAVLEAFTTGDPDGNGINGDTYGVSAAGLIAAEAPYVNYLPEFYWNAYPSFIKGEDGVWYDGFNTQEFKDALVRLQDAYQKGYIDKEALTNTTNDVRNKFYEDKFGVFTYWAGTWASNLKLNLENNGHSGELVAIEPIAELNGYIERIPPVWSITEACENPEGVYKYFLEAMLDGGEMQKLWTYGVEDVHWSTKAETILDNTYAEGEFHQLESLEKPGTQYKRQHLDPMLVVASWDGDPGKGSIDEEALVSQETFNAHTRQLDLVPSTEEMAMYNGDLVTLKNSVVADVVVQGMDVEEAYKRFETELGLEWSNKIVDALNALQQ